MFTAKDQVKFREVSVEGKEPEMLEFICRLWRPSNQATIAYRSVEQKYSMVLEVINEMGLQDWLLKKVVGLPIQKYLHGARGHYSRYVIPLEEAGFVRHGLSDKVKNQEWQWIYISEKVMYRRKIS